MLKMFPVQSPPSPPFFTVDSGKRAFIVLPMSYETKLSVSTYPVHKTLGLSAVTAVDKFIYLVLHVVLEECNHSAITCVQ